TALTRAVTLSRVMTSCGGMVRVTTRWSTRTDRSKNGSMRTRPGPRAPRRRPRRKTTRRSYSRTTLRDATSTATSRATTTTVTGCGLGILARLPPVGRVAGPTELDRGGRGARARLTAGTPVRAVGGPPALQGLQRRGALLQVLLQ